MNVLVLGSGAREHALAWKVSQSSRLTKLWCAPGNAGIAEVAETFALDLLDHDAVVAAAREREVDLVVVGPEAPLVAGLADALRQANISVFGPGKAGAQLEGSKAFSKRFMRRHGIPTAAFEVFDDVHKALAFLDAHPRAWVVKADGLASGKGVVVAKDIVEARAAVHEMMSSKRFGAAGETVVLEETLEGQEISYHIVCDGARYVPLAAAQDHKRLLDGDAGPNTGGMGAYSPPSFLTPELESKIRDRVIEPTLAGLRAEGLALRGTLFLGLMIVQGDPYLLEYNVRFGDPETEALVMRYRGDFLGLLASAAEGDLHRAETPEWFGASACVVLAAHGYPEAPRAGDVIHGLDHGAESSQAQCFHAGTARNNGTFVTQGGRVLVVSAAAPTVEQALESAYEAASQIRFAGMQYRRDIGWQTRTTKIRSSAQT